MVDHNFQQLIRCRYCGRGEVAISEEPDADAECVTFAMCAVCGARGPLGEGPEDAAEKWNRVLNSETAAKEYLSYMAEVQKSIDRLVRENPAIDDDALYSLIPAFAINVALVALGLPSESEGHICHDYWTDLWRKVCDGKLSVDQFVATVRKDALDLN